MKYNVYLNPRHPIGFDQLTVIEAHSRRGQPTGPATSWKSAPPIS